MAVINATHRYILKYKRIMKHLILSTILPISIVLLSNGIFCKDTGLRVGVDTRSTTLEKLSLICDNVNEVNGMYIGSLTKPIVIKEQEFHNVLTAFSNNKLIALQLSYCLGIRDGIYKDFHDEKYLDDLAKLLAKSYLDGLVEYISNFAINAAKHIAISPAIEYDDDGEIVISLGDEKFVYVVDCSRNNNIVTIMVSCYFKENYSGKLPQKVTPAEDSEDAPKFGLG